MFIEVLSKIISESLLSLYPIFVKFINLPIELQLWTRFFIYSLISCFFVDWSFIIQNIFTKNAILLFIITSIHVYTSYRGFLLLDSGVAYVLFYTYPLMILLMSGQKFNIILLFAIFGVYLLSNNDFDKKNNNDEIESNKKETFIYEGIIMMIIAAFTEASIYFIVRKIKTPNNWNHVLFSYGISAILLTFYNYNYINNFLKNILDNIKSIINNKNYLNLKVINDNSRMNLSNDLSIDKSINKELFSDMKENTNKSILYSLLGNSIIGLLGYLLRFYSISKLNPKIYATLSYIGIIMAYIYGIFIYKDIINIKKIIGTLLIVIPNIYYIIE
jgi:drug/metabolite transporter (DMT)-like permease